MSRSALIASVIASALLLPKLASAQCKCAPGEVPIVYRASQSVFEGKLVTTATPEREPSTIRYTFLVTKAWKGATAGEKITLVADKAGACAVKLSEGASNIIGATDEGLGFASLKPCHKFFKSSSAKDAPALRKTLDGFAPAKAQLAKDGDEQVKSAVATAPTKTAKKKKKK